MKIGIDARLSGLKHAGIGRYTQNLLQKILEYDKKNSYVFFFYDEQQATEVLADKIKSKNVKIVITPIKHYSLAEQLYLPKIFSQQKLDLLHVPHFNIPIFYSGKLVVTIHDLLWHEYKGGTVTTLNPIMYALKYLFYRVVTKAAVLKAKKILVPAQTIKETVATYYPTTQNKIVITKEGSQLLGSGKAPATKQKNTLLYVGSLYPHKNIKLVLRALEFLPKYKLLIAGSRSVFQERVEVFVADKELEKRVTFLGYVPDEELAELYKSVTALVQPSFSEGFGLTGVEAMSVGTPILASHIPIFREIYQDVAFYFSPFSVPSFVQAVQLLESTQLETRLTQGKKLADTYSWDDMAKQTLQVYRSL